MKIIKLLIITTFISICCVEGSEIDLWHALHAGSQNLGRKVMAAEGAQDPTAFDVEEKRVAEAIAALLKAEVVVHKDYKLKYKGNAEDILAMLGSVDFFIEKYGVFSTGELLGLGGWFRGKLVSSGGVITLSVHLPEGDLALFDDAIKKSEIQILE